MADKKFSKTIETDKEVIEQTGELVEKMMNGECTPEQPSVKAIIVVSEDGMFTNIPVPLDKMANIFCAALTAAVNQIDTQLKAGIEAKEITEKDREVARKEIFDGLNAAFSRQLDIAFPDFEMHPELTEEVMQKVLDGEKVVAMHRAKAKNKKK